MNQEQRTNKKFFNNMGLKLLALVCSFGIWFVVMNIEDGVISRTITDIPVEMLNGESILENGNLYNITDGENVDVIVKGPRSTVENLDVPNFTATADLSHLSVTNSTTIEVSLNNTVASTKAKKVTITPIDQYVTLSIEQEDEKSIPVRVITTGTPDSDYAAGSAIPTPNMVTVSGPASVLSNIVEARAVVNITGASSDVESTVSLGCIDGYGTAIEKDNITLSSTDVTVNIPIYETKEIPVNISTAGSVHEGFGIRAINFEPSSITIAGESEILESIESVEVSDVVVTDATSNIEKNIDIMGYLPSDVFVPEGSVSEIAVNVEIAEKSETEISIASSDIHIDDADDSLKYEITEQGSIKIKVQGFEEDIADIEANTLGSRISVKDLEPGEYELQISFAESDKFSIKDTYLILQS